MVEPVLLKLGISHYRNDVIREDALKAFESTHSDVKVKLVMDCHLYDLENHPHDQTFDINLNHAKNADVLFASSYNVTETLTRTGYFLDLMPFTRQAADSDDF